jgi:hypothetical protein
VKDLKKTNPVTKKSSTVYIKLIRLTLKKNISTMLKARKASVKARVPLKSPIKRLAKALIKEVIVSGIAGTSASSRIIRLLQCFRENN